MSDYLLATADPSWPERVHALVGGPAKRMSVRYEATLADASDIEHELQRTQATVLVVGPGYEDEQSLALARTVHEHRPDVSVILVARTSPVLLQEAVRAGVRDVIDPVASDHVVRGSLQLAFDSARRRREALGVPASVMSQVIAVMSPKGGAGKTAVASNLAAGLAAVAPNEVVVVDFDLRFGDVADALGLTPERTIADLARDDVELDARTVRAALTAHPGGLSVLCAPHLPAEALAVKPELLAGVLELLAAMFRYVVVDTGAGLDEAALTAAARATDVVLVCATDVASARSLRKGVELLDMLGFTQARRHFVLNRADARVGITIQDIEAIVGLDVAVALPSTRVVPASMNRGEPVTVADPRGPAAKAITQLVARFAVIPTLTRSRLASTGSRRRRAATRAWA